MNLAELRLSALRGGRRKLVQVMAELGYGRIEGLIVHRGRPVFNPSPRVIRVIKLGAPDAPSKGHASPPDYVLKEQVLQLLQTLQELGDGRVETLVIANGLPISATLESR